MRSKLQSRHWLNVMDTQECPKAEPTAEIILILKMQKSSTKRCIPKAKPQGNEVYNVTREDECPLLPRMVCDSHIQALIKSHSQQSDAQQ